jgi:probable phosphoglycerate mutase
MRLHLIRHGTTDTSGRTFAGRSDVPLNTEGRRMAQDIGHDLASMPITRVMSSPLSRAIETARPLAEGLGLEIETDPRLFEIDFGVFEGQPKTDLGLKLRKAHAVQPIPDGEALLDVWHRAADFLQGLQPSGGQIAIVGHYWINRMLFGHVSGLDFEAACRSRAYRPKTGSVLQLRFRGPCPIC